MDTEQCIPENQQKIPKNPNKCYCAPQYHKPRAVPHEESRVWAGWWMHFPMRHLTYPIDRLAQSSHVPVARTLCCPTSHMPRGTGMHAKAVCWMHFPVRHLACLIQNPFCHPRSVSKGTSHAHAVARCTRPDLAYDLLAWDSLVAVGDACPQMAPGLAGFRTTTLPCTCDSKKTSERARSSRARWSELKRFFLTMDGEECVV